MPQNETPIFYRYFRIKDDSVSDDGVITMRASTDDAISMGDWRESLSHDEGAVDMEAARSLLINHNPNQLAGSLEEMRLENGALEVRAKVDPDAKMQSGVSVLSAIRSNSLRGVSVGYTYERSAMEIDEEARTVRVNKWRLLEVSLTPIPADSRGQVRSFPEKSPQANNGQEGVTRMSDNENKPAQPGPDQAEIAKQARDAAKKETKEVIAFARSYNIDADKVVDMSMEQAKDFVLAEVRNKLQSETPDPQQNATRTAVTVDAGDKLLATAARSLYAKAGLAPDGEDAELIKRHSAGVSRLSGIIADMARADGHRNLSTLDLASYAGGLVDLRTHGRRDAPNKVTAGFSTLLANVANKSVMQGLNSYNAATWNQWCSQKTVADFKQVTNAGLASGRLARTPEGEAFPELVQKDGGYNSQLGLFGATISLSFQALVNDDLNGFMDELRRIGAIAAETMDYEAYRALLTATWTNDVSASASLATKDNLDKPRAALKNKLGPAGNKRGVVARFLLHATANARPAQEATGLIFSGGQTTAPSVGSSQIVPIESHWIDDTSILGGAAATDYYVAGNPGVVDTVVASFLEGVGMSPIIMPYDAGAVAAEKWKIMVPFDFTVATYADSAGNTRISGIQKATA